LLFIWLVAIALPYVLCATIVWTAGARDAQERERERERERDTEKKGAHTQQIDREGGGETQREKGGPHTDIDREGGGGQTERRCVPATCGSGTAPCRILSLLASIRNSDVSVKAWGSWTRPYVHTYTRLAHIEVTSP
jgi:hypothetical protein